MTRTVSAVVLCTQTLRLSPPRSHALTRHCLLTPLVCRIACRCLLAGMALMMEMQSNPRVMEAAMDIAMNGEEAAEKYATDEEVMALLRKLEGFNDRMGFT